MDESLIEHCDFPNVPWPTHDIYIYIHMIIHIYIYMGYGHPAFGIQTNHALVDSCGLVTISQGPANPTHAKCLRHLAPFLRGGIPWINGSSINPATNHLVSHLAIMSQNHESAKQSH